MAVIEDTQQTDNKEETGILHWVRSHTPTIIKDNAPRIVAGLKIIGCSSMLFSKNRVFSIAGGGFVGAFGMIAMFGGKKSEEEKEKIRQEEEAKKQESASNGENKATGYLADYTTKLLHPSKYPIESGTALAMLSSTFWTASGIFGKDGFSPGRLFGGALSFCSDANIVFTKEQIGEKQSNPHKEGSPSYYLTELRHRPVLLSSMFNIGSDIASIVGGAHEYSKGKERNTLMAGSFLLAANVFQAIFVDKNDYNIEQKSDAKTINPEKLEIASPDEKPSTQLITQNNNANLAWIERTKKPEVSSLQAIHA